MSDTGKKKVLAKVVYFDEGSVTDFLQIAAGGQLNKTTELLNNSSAEANVSADGKMSVGISSVFRSLLGLEVKVGVESKIGAQTKSNEMAHHILQNTILTDFYTLVNEGEENGVRCFTNYRIKVIKESLGYYIMLSPYMSMLQSKNGIKIDNMPDMAVAVDKLDNTLREAKGYYELVGVSSSGKSKVVFRFNLNAFRNNYKISDLTKMDLIIYAIKVGKTTADKLNIKSELDIPVIAPRTLDNPSYAELAQEEDATTEQIDTSKMEIYDVLLAGVAGTK